jgi:hypothetical protein
MLGTYPLSATPLSAIGLTVRLTAAAGAFALTGGGAAEQLTLSASSGSYALTGQDVQFGKSFSLSAGAGAYALTGQDAAFARGRSLTASAGSFTLSGQAAGRQIKEAAGAGSYALTGQAAAVGIRRTVTGGTGAYTLTGRAANLFPAKIMPSAAGSYVLTGQAVTLTLQANPLGRHAVNTLTSPTNFRGELDANTVRTNDNIVAQAFTAHDADASIHLPSGLLAQRPTSPVEGAKWLATDTQDTYLYTGGQWVQVGWAHWYGGFSDYTDQTQAAINTAKAITFNTTDVSRGVSVVSSSRLTVSYTGIYNLMWSGQFVNTDSQIQDVDIWIRVNGTDVTGSTGRVSVPNKHGSIDGHVLPAWNYFLTLNANDYVELYWAVTNTSVSLQTNAASAWAPSTASVIATLNRV